MGYYKKLFSNSIKVAGAMAKSFLMPPDGAFTKIGFELYEALDLICEGPIFGLVDQRGRLLGKSKEIPTLVATHENQESFTGVFDDAFTAENNNGGTARVYFGLEEAILNSEIEKVEIEFFASNLSGSTYTIELVEEEGGTTQTSAEKINVSNGANLIILNTNAGSTSRAVMFEVTGNSIIQIADFTIRKFAVELTAIKEFDSEENKIGSSKQGIDKGIYFDDNPLRNEQNSANVGKYAVSLKLGEEFQDPHPEPFGTKPQKMTPLGIPIRGPYDMGGVTVTDAKLTAIRLQDVGGQVHPGAVLTQVFNMGQFRRVRRDRAIRTGLGSASAQVINAILTKVFELTPEARGFKLTIVSSDPVLINVLKSELITNLDSPTIFRLSGLAGDDSRQINFSDKRGSIKKFVFRELFDNSDGSITAIAYGAIAFGDGAGGFTAGPDDFLLTGQTPGNADFAGLLTVTSTASDGARTGGGSADIRTEGTDARDFVNWQKFVPLEKAARPYKYVNYDSNIDQLTATLQIDRLSDTKSFSSDAENRDGKSKMGTPLPTTVTVQVKVGKVDKDGVVTEENGVFTTRGGSSVTVGEGNGVLSVEGIVTSPYTVSLEEIFLPKLEEGDLYNFMTINKVEYETISNLVNRDIGIKSITEITNINFRYPYATSIATSIDARYYPSVPERTFRAKGKKVLIPSNYTPIDPSGVDRRFSSDKSTRGNLIYSGAWDGTFKFGWTDNPAWIYYDLLINTRYGLGSYLRDSDIIDKWSLFEIGQYCDAVTVNDGSRTSVKSGAGVFIGLDDGHGGLEPRFSCNILFKDQKNAFDALQNIARSFSAMSFYNNSIMSLRVDQPYFYTNFNRDEAYENAIAASGIPEPPKELKYPPHLVFNNGNVAEGIFQYSDTDKTNRLSAIEVSFLDKSTNYTQQTEYVENGELIKQFGLNVSQINGIGVTSRSQAHRLAKYALFESANSVETINFKAGFEALMLTPGDIIQVDDELKNFTKNYGTVLATSGEVIYFDPDDAGVAQDTMATGIGPRAILVQPALGSTQLERLGSGNIHVYSPIGKSGSNEFYTAGSGISGYSRAINEPQVISLKLREGGVGKTFDQVDDGVLFHIDTTGIFKAAGAENTVLPTQWFAESTGVNRAKSRKNANLIGGTSYSIDVGGINRKYYRVLSIAEDDELGYNISALIHHTGKFKFVEENLNFDTTPDTFQPDLKLTTVARPNPPSGITSGQLAQTSTPAFGDLRSKLKLPLQIHAASSLPGDQYVIVIEEPNLNRTEVVRTRVLDATSVGGTDITNFEIGSDVLGFLDKTRIDQIGTYNVNIFSEVLSPILTRSLTATNFSFTINADDFGINTATDSFIEYKNISLLTDFNTNYDQENDLGTGQNSFIENNPEINATFQLDFQDIFGNSGTDILDKVVEQRIDILDATGKMMARNFKTIGKTKQFQITNTGLSTAFGVGSGQEDNLFAIPQGLKFQGGQFRLTGSKGGSAASTLGFMDNTGTFIRFETDTNFYERPPVVLTQQLVSGNYKDTNGLVTRQQPLGRVLVEKSGFLVANSNLHQTRYCYFASPTGVFNIAGNVIQVGSGIINTVEESEENTVEFPEEFGSVPTVVVQLQNAAHTGDRSAAGIELLGHSAYASTTTEEVTTTGFKFTSHTETGAQQQSGVFGYIATDADTFNILNTSSFSLNSLNLATLNINPINTPTYVMTGSPILTDTNKVNTRFNFAQQMPFVQNTGIVHTGQHLAIHRIGTGNFIISHPMVTGMPKVSGFRTETNKDKENLVRLDFIAGIGSPGDAKVMPTFSVTSNDIAILNDSNGNEFRGITVGDRVGTNIPDIRIKSLTVDTNGSNISDTVTVSVSHSSFSVPANITQESGPNNGTISAGQTDGGSPTFTVNLSAGSVTSVTVSNSGSNRFRPTEDYFLNQGESALHQNWSVSVGGGGPSAAVGGPEYTGTVHIATMVNVPENADNQMFILDNVFSGQLDDNGQQLVPNVNKSGFAFFLSGSPDLHTYLYLDGTDYKLSNVKINDGENHFIEAHINRENANGNGRDEIVGYVDGQSGLSAHSFEQSNVVNYMFSGQMALFNSSGRHGQGVSSNAAEFFPFNSGVIIDAIAMFTGRNRFGQKDDEGNAIAVDGSLYQAKYKTGLGAFINLHAADSKCCMLTEFTGSSFNNALLGAGGVSNRGYTPTKIGNFEKTDFILKRNDIFNIDVIQIGNTGFLN